MKALVLLQNFLDGAANLIHRLSDSAAFQRVELNAADGGSQRAQDVGDPRDAFGLQSPLGFDLLFQKLARIDRGLFGTEDGLVKGELDLLIALGFFLIGRTLEVVSEQRGRGQQSLPV